MLQHELFPIHKHGCRKGGRNLKSSAEKAVILVSSGENDISPILVTPYDTSPILATPPEKILPTTIHTSM